MARKHPILPNGFGQIKYLGKKRRNPYGVYPPATDRYDSGTYKTPKAICYVPDWYTAFSVLTAWHAGTYQKGMELEISMSAKESRNDLDVFCETVLKNFDTMRGALPRDKTFGEVRRAWYDFKHGEHATKQRTSHTDDVACGYLQELDDKPFRALTLDDLQKFVNSVHSVRKREATGQIVLLKESSLKHVIRVLKEIYAYADIRDLCDKNFARYLTMPDREGIEKGSPFWDEDLRILWRHKDMPVIRSLLIMCYSGFRISAWKTMEINLEEGYFKGGVKTAAGKGRIVPIHSAILPLVPEAVADGGVIPCENTAFAYRMERDLKLIGVDRRTPHDCRHTFSRLCEHFGVPEADRKRLLGHSLSGDITNGVYGHRTLEELRASIELIQVPEFVASCCE